ncbi:autocrine proliferation repressor protein A-like [Mytilus edulis]|uniref:autocrine proliferation repressor protein A-like n=1 Tax=Mytilus edulis TaxID=6550 RepID=UPI0039F0D734
MNQTILTIHMEQAFIIWITALSFAVGSPLDDYVHTPDHHYNFSELNMKKGPGYTLYVYNMTSLKWKSEANSDHPIWWHYLEITIPDKIVHKDTALMLIDGGHNTPKWSPVDEAFVAMTTALAVSTGSVCADLKMIPNQPIMFKADPTKRHRTEDAIIAWTWRKFVENNGTDPEIIMQFPMTKAAVRGLDTIASVVKTKTGVNIDKFVVTGASKRGWITWLTGAVDKRVIAIAPIVMDLLNFVQNLHHHYRSLGGWTFEFKEYYKENFTGYLDNPLTQKMASYIDPLAYNDRYETVHKMIITSSGDEFFLTDDSHYYYNQLAGPKYLRIVPDTEHTLIGHLADTMLSIRAFYLSILTNKDLPKMFWKREITSIGGRITLFTNMKPKTVKVKFAVTTDTKRRDFRLFVGEPDNPTHKYPHPVLWFSDKIKDFGNNTFVAEYDNPLDGRWLGFFIQVTFDGVDGSVEEYTTEAQIIPDVFPFPDCHGKECHGSLV